MTTLPIRLRASQTDAPPLPEETNSRLEPISIPWNMTATEERSKKQVICMWIVSNLSLKIIFKKFLGVIVLFNFQEIYDGKYQIVLSSVFGNS